MYTYVERPLSNPAIRLIAKVRRTERSRMAAAATPVGHSVAVYVLDTRRGGELWGARMRLTHSAWNKLILRMQEDPAVAAAWVKENGQLIKGTDRKAAISFIHS